MSFALTEIRRLTPPQFDDCLRDYLTRQPFSEKGRPLDGLSEFTRKVLLETAKIEWGTTITYAQLAGRLGMPKAVRAVASALGRNPYPFVIPCHRVVASNGGLGGYAWGLKLKMALLSYEKGC